METYISRIESYLEGALPEDERRRFESELQSDPELQSAFNLYQQGNQIIEWNISENLRAQLDTWAQEDAGRQTKPGQGAKLVSFRQLRWAAAAAVVLLLSVWAVFDRFSGPRMDDAALFAAYYEAPLDSGLRGPDGKENPVVQGIRMLREGRGEAARDYFAGLLETEPGNPEYRYYAGHAALLLQDWSAAADAFAQAERLAPVSLAQKAMWNRVLALLSAGRTAEMEPLLDAIASNPEHGFQQQALKLKRARKG